MTDISHINVLVYWGVIFSCESSYRIGFFGEHYVLTGMSTSAWAVSIWSIWPDIAVKWKCDDITLIAFVLIFSSWRHYYYRELVFLAKQPCYQFSPQFLTLNFFVETKNLALISTAWVIKWYWFQADTYGDGTEIVNSNVKNVESSSESTQDSDEENFNPNISSPRRSRSLSFDLGEELPSPAGIFKISIF